ncbi:MAG: hypothetical protein U0175_39560 [Caldilineaceae bacterium]
MISPAPQTYKQLIVDGSQDLPRKQSIAHNLLIEIADFVTFLRKRATNPEILIDEQVALQLNQNLQQMSNHEANHLEMEFQNYKQRFPRQE